MSVKQTGLSCVEYVIGEIELDVDALPNKADVLAAHQMPDMKELWGWRTCRKTAYDPAALAIAAARRTLMGKVGAGAIDALIVCCGEPLNYFGQNRFIAQFAEAVGLDRFTSQWLGGSGCVTLFAALRLASDMVSVGSARHVLVVAVDRVPDDAMRFQRFGVLSDGACSFVVTNRTGADFAIVDAIAMSATRTLEKSDDFQAKCDLMHAALERFGEGTNFDFSRVEALFCANVFLPIQELEISLLPMDGILPWQDNTARYGHCYAADPFINLIDFHREPQGRETRLSLMTATAHGHFGIVALERLNA